MILVVNAGSSNTKLAIYDSKTLEAQLRIKVSSIDEAISFIKMNNNKYNFTAVGHRIVHGGTRFLKPIIINKKIIVELENLIPLAPLHQPHNIAVIKAISSEYPNLPQVGCFDTAFHSTQMQLAKEFAIPKEYTEQGVIRYGFHGLSYEYIASVLEKNIGVKSKGKIIVAHLGNGASMCAMGDLQSVATSMGFSTLDGLMMGTRCGSIDPGVLLYFLQTNNFTIPKLEEFLYHKCGLLGVSGISNDVQKLLENDAKQSKHALNMFCYKAAQQLSSLVVPLTGCDGVIFTGGIGENSAYVRKGICDYLSFMDAKIDQEKNNNNNTLIHDKSSKILIGIIPTNEEYIIAKHTLRVLLEN